MTNNKLAKRSMDLPDNIKDLTRFVLIGREKLVAVRAEIRAIDKIGLGIEVKNQKQEEAAMLAGALLDAEARIGELLIELETHHGSSFKGKRGGSRPSTPEGITHNQSSQFQALAANKDLIEQVKAEAKENDDLPTRTEVLRKIKENNREREKGERRKEYTKRAKGGSVINIYKTDKSFRVIYADPPWAYNDQQNTDKLGGAKKHYETMSIKQLKELPIIKIKEKNAVLFLWVTSPLLEECFEVINAWGFKYKASFIWDKIKHNMGHYNSVRHEFLLVCVSGSCLPDNNKLYDSVVQTERTGKHSEKPVEFINMIDDLYTYGDRIELFARDQKKENWCIWGDEA